MAGPQSSNLQRGNTQSSVGSSVNARRNQQNGVHQVLDLGEGRILCVADVRGELSKLNQLASDTGAKAIIHTGDFGFYEKSSLDRISDRTLRHLVQYSTLVPDDLRPKLLADATNPAQLRQNLNAHKEPLLSEFPLFLSGERSLKVPVFTVWGACEDVAVLEKFRSQEYKIPNLYILDEATSRVVDIGGIRLRMLGLGGAVVHHKLFDNGEGSGTIAGGSGTMWTTMLQIGELVDTFKRNFDPTETRLVVTHASPGREGLLAQLALQLRADLTVSAGLHFRYGVSYNEFSVQHDQENYRNKLATAQKSFNEIWENVRTQVESYVDDHQRLLLSNALAVVNRLPPSTAGPGKPGPDKDEPAFKNMWNFNLPDAAFGWVALDIHAGRISSEIKSHGFNFAYRRQGVQNNLPSPAPATETVAKFSKEPEIKKETEEEDQAPPKSAGGQSSSSAGGGVTPTSSRGGVKPGRNPNTAYVSNLPLPIEEEDVKSMFPEDVRKGITLVKLVDDRLTGIRKSFCYVEFGDAEALQAAVAVQNTTIRDQAVRVVVAEDRTARFGGHMNGRGSPRGGRGGPGRGFSGRGFGGRGGSGGSGDRGGFRGGKTE